MLTRCLLAFFIFLAFSAVPEASIGAPNPKDSLSNEQEALRIGVKSSPPFLIEEDGKVQKGIAYDLWVKIAEEKEWDHRSVRFDTLSNLLTALEEGRLDLSITPLTVTRDRLDHIDFTHPFYVSNLVIATQKKTKDRVLQFIQNFFSLNFLRAVLLLILIILIFGLLLWVVEKSKNPDMFRKGWRGVMDGFWWSAVTMTTVGYGDKAPISGIGKAIATIWMFTAVIIVSGFTATIASSLTVQRAQGDIEDIHDLAKVKTITVEESNSATFLRKKGIDPKQVPTLNDALEQLKEGKVEALFYDEPLLQYLIHQKGYNDDLVILKQNFQSQYYSFGLANKSPYKDELNKELLKVLESTDWDRILQRYDL